MVPNETTPKVGSVSISYPNFLDWRAQSHSFSEMAAVAQTSWNMAGGSQPENVKGEAVSPNFLSMLGVRPMLGHSVKIAGIGVAIGLAASFGLMRLIVKLLYSVSAADPLTFSGVGMALLVVAVLACYVPARRTLRVDPMTALRYE